MRKIYLLFLLVVLQLNVKSANLTLNDLIKVTGYSISEFSDKFDNWSGLSVSDVDVVIARYNGSETISIGVEGYESRYLVDNIFLYKNMLNNIKRSGFKQYGDPYVNDDGDIIYEYIKGNINIVVYRLADDHGLFIVRNEERNNIIKAIQFAIDSLKNVNEENLKSVILSGDSLFKCKRYVESVEYYNVAVELTTDDYEKKILQSKIDYANNIIVLINNRDSLFTFELQDKLIANDMMSILFNDIKSTDNVEFDLICLTDTLGKTNISLAGISIADSTISKLNKFNFGVKLNSGIPIRYKNMIHFKLDITTDTAIVLYFNVKGKWYFDMLNNENNDYYCSTLSKCYDDGVYTIKIERKKLIPCDNTINYCGGIFKTSEDMVDYERNRRMVNDYKYRNHGRGKKFKNGMVFLTYSGVITVN